MSNSAKPAHLANLTSRQRFTGDIGEALGILDFERAGKLSCARFTEQRR